MIRDVTHDQDLKPKVRTIKAIENRWRGDLLLIFEDGSHDVLHRGKYVPGELQPGDKVTVHEGVATKLT